ncbi:MAG: hypothetical protein ABJH06_01690 [Paraglaciecola sp.]|uniref:hypothetical protein n=1 Tax=Paraglaciecola sp. TaxID=1920173 RepID=UPI003299AAE7
MEGSSCPVCGSIISGGFCTSSSCLDSPNWTVNNGNNQKYGKQPKPGKTRNTPGNRVHVNKDKNWQTFLTISSFIGILIYLLGAQGLDLIAGAILSGLGAAIVYKFYKVVQILICIGFVMAFIYFTSK